MAKRIIPTDPAELQEMLNDSNVMTEMMREGASGDPSAFQEFMKNYQIASLSKDPSLLEQNKEQFESFLVDWLRDKGEIENIRALNFDPNSGGKVAKNTLYNKAAMGAKYDKHFASLPELLYSISDHSVKELDLSKRLNELRNDASSIKPSDGGFLIPEILRAEVLQLALETAIVRPRARVIPMDSLRVPFPSVDSTSNVSSVYGGITGYWTEEGATLTESQPRFGRVVLEAHKLTLYTEVPNELIQDSRPSFTAFIDQMFPEALGWFEDIAFFIGGGVGEPLGYLNSPSAISATRNAGGNAVEYVDITNMYARMLPQSLGRAVWVVSPDVLPNLFQMTISGGTSPLWIGGAGFPSAAESPPMALLGRPLIVSEKARAVGNSGDINFVDFGMYLIGDRQALTARQSEDFRFQNDLTAFRVIERLDGRSWLQAPITPQNNGPTLSPFIKLT